LAVHSNVLTSRQMVNAILAAGSRVRIGGEFTAAQYAIDGPTSGRSTVRSNAGAGSVTVLVVRSKSASLDLGIRGELLSFAPSTVNLLTPTRPDVASSAGFF